MVHSQIPVLITIDFLVYIIPSGVMLTTTSYYFGTTSLAYGQTNQMNSNTFNLLKIPIKKVHVGDIDIAYKAFGKGYPILLISGSGLAMDQWQQSVLRDLSRNHTVIIFDNRGVGNTTIGTKPFSIQQFANDTVDLLDILKIQKADVLGFSMGSFIAQEVTLLHPEKAYTGCIVAPLPG